MINRLPLSYKLAEYYICEDCLIVDRDKNRCSEGHKCSRCNSPSRIGMSYFTESIKSLIDLIQEIHRLDKNRRSKKQVSESHQIAIIIFFCTLMEVLLTHFLKQLMTKKMELSFQLQKRLLEDNKFVKERLEKLFTALLNVKWNNAVSELNKNSKFNYRTKMKFYVEVSGVRNKFIHTGDKWVIPTDMPQKCISNIRPLVNFFVDLHNRYVAK